MSMSMSMCICVCFCRAGGCSEIDLGEGAKVAIHVPDWVCCVVGVCADVSGEAEARKSGVDVRHRVTRC